MQSENKSWSHIPLAIITTLLWGSAFAGAKVGFEYMTPLMLSGLRFSFAGLLLVPMIFILKIDWRESFRQWQFMLLFGVIQTALQYGIFFIGLNMVPAAVAAIIIGAGPLFITIMAHFTLENDKFTVRKVASVTLGLLGVIFISLSKGELNSDNPLFYKGITLLIISNLIGSYTNIMVVKRKNKVSPVVLTMVANFSGGILLFIVSLFVEDRTLLFQDFPTKFYLALTWLAIIPAAAFSIWYYLLGRPGVVVSELNIWKFLIPIIGACLSWIIIPEENADVTSIVGMIIIATSIIVLQLPKQKKQN